MMDQIEKFKRLEKENYFIITKTKDVLLQIIILEENSKDIGKNLKIIQKNTFNSQDKNHQVFLIHKL